MKRLEVGRSRGTLGQRCRRGLRRAMFAGALMLSSLMPLGRAHADEPAAQPACQAEQAPVSGWAAIRPGYLPVTNQPTLRLEGGASSTIGTSFYGFVDFQPSEEDSASMDSFYGELRVLQRLYAGLGVYAELDAGSGMVPVFRPGLAYTLNPDGWLIQMRLSPYSLGGANDIQPGLYVSKTFAERIFTEALVKGNIISGTIYSELAADIIFLERLSAGLQVRIFADPGAGQTDVAPLLRAGVTF